MSAEVLTFVSVTGLSAVLTFAALQAAHRLRLLDPLEARRLHTELTPRGGGLGIALVLGVALLSGLAEGPSWLLAAGLLACAGVGLADDIRPLPPIVKLLGQLCGAWLAAMALPVPGLPPYLGMALAALSVLVAVNVWNFMDGSNGMAASQGLLVAAALAWLAALPLAVWLAAASLGFLPFNMPRARVFLGDVGSHALGYGVAVVGLAAMRSSDFAPAALLVLVSAFMLDAGWTLLARIWRREAFWKAHSAHLYQRAIRRGTSHLRVCLAYLAWTVGSALLARAMRLAPLSLQWGLAALWLGLGSTFYFALGHHWQRALARAGSPTQ